MNSPLTVEKSLKHDGHLGDTTLNHEPWKLYASGTPMILLETLSSRAAKVLLIFSYIIFILSIVFDVQDDLSKKKTSQVVPGECSETNSFETSSCIYQDSENQYNWHSYFTSVDNIIGAFQLRASFHNESSLSNLTDFDSSTIKYDLFVKACQERSGCNNSEWKHVIRLDHKVSEWNVRNGVRELVFVTTFQNQEVLSDKAWVHSYEASIQFVHDKYNIFDSNSQAILELEYTRGIDSLSRNFGRLFILFFTCLYGSYWIHSLLKSEPDVFKWLPERKLMSLFLLGLILYQNPIYCIAVFFNSVSPSVAYASEIFSLLGIGIMLFEWLAQVDGYRRKRMNDQIDSSQFWFYIVKFLLVLSIVFFSLTYTTIAYPSLYSARNPIESAVEWDDELQVLYITCCVGWIALVLVWGIAFFRALLKTGSDLTLLPYMRTRYLQLSYRFFVLQSLLVATALFVQNMVSIVSVIQQADSNYGIDALLEFFVTYVRTQTHPLGRLVFLSIYGMVGLFIHLSPTKTSSLSMTFVLTEREARVWKRNAFHRKKQFLRSSNATVESEGMPLEIDRNFRDAEDVAAVSTRSSPKPSVPADNQTAPRIQRSLSTRILHDTSSAVTRTFESSKATLRQIMASSIEQTEVFCVETASWLMETSWQAYYDLPGNKTKTRYGEVDLSPLKLEVVEVIQSDATELYAMVLRHKTNRRLIVVFRGTCGRRHWESNLRFSKIPINFMDLPLNDLDNRDELDACSFGTPAFEPDIYNSSPSLYNSYPSLKSGNTDSSSAKSNHQDEKSSLKQPLLDAESDTSNPAYSLGWSGQCSESSGILSSSPSGFSNNISMGSVVAAEDDEDDHEAQKKSINEDIMYAVSASLDPLPEIKPSIVEPNERKTIDMDTMQHRGTISDRLQSAISGASQRVIEGIPAISQLVKVHIHQGYWESYIEIREKLHDIIRREMKLRPSHLYFTGHSLGGALATIAALDVTIHTVARVNDWLSRTYRAGPVQKVRTTMYNFGSPRVGNRAFAQLYNNIVPDSFRVIVDGDLISGLPKWGYKHIETEIVINGDGDGSIIIDPSFIERWLRTRGRRNVRRHLLQYYRAGLEGVRAASLSVAATTANFRHVRKKQRHSARGSLSTKMDVTGGYTSETRSKQNRARGESSGSISGAETNDDENSTVETDADQERNDRRNPMEEELLDPALIGQFYDATSKDLSDNDEGTGFNAIHAADMQTVMSFANESHHS